MMGRLLKDWPLAASGRIGIAAAVTAWVAFILFAGPVVLLMFSVMA